jgi:5-(carboxyamino)imidazole ribonucleotide synthase
MLAMAAARLGLRTVILEPDPDCPAAQTANRHIAAGYDDEAALDALAAACDVITYEFENVPVSAVRRLQAVRPVFPDAEALRVSQDRIAEKQFFAGLGIEVAPFFAINSLLDLEQALAACGGEGILKTRRLGYDGKGQTRIGAQTEARQAFRQLGAGNLILEGVVPFDLEVSVVAARDVNGSTFCYDPALNEHENGILRRSTVPAPLTASLLQQIRNVARRITQALDYRGVIGIECFVLSGDRLLVNEIAPRVHNSGHWTEAACTISQFENHVRAISGLPLGNTTRHSDCEMTNLLGPEIAHVGEIAAEPQAAVHIYGKIDSRPGRKMGHVTRLRPRRD